MIIRIKNLRLRTIIGLNPWEKLEAQSLILNVELEFDGSRATISDNINDTIDYRSISNALIKHVDTNRYELIEALAGNLLELIMEDARVTRARLEIDKPKALSSADSTSVEVSAIRE